MAYLLRKFALLYMILGLVVVLICSDRSAERLGDNLQIALPLMGLGCAMAQGQGVQYFGRYLVLEAGIKIPKYALGNAEINLRPNGRDRGFPSGHTAAASFGAAGLVKSCLQASPVGQSIAILGAGFTGTSRVEAGKHTIWQVLAGALWGWAVQFIAFRRFDRWFVQLWSSIASIRRRTMDNLRQAARALPILMAPLFLGNELRAEFELSGYIGPQIAHDSNIDGEDPAGVGAFDFTATWEGRSFDTPPHYGIRGTWWRNQRFGWHLDFNHLKVYADDDTLADSGFSRLEFTDGLNTLTAGPIWRWQDAIGPKWTPYAGFGVGLSIPYVEVQTTSTSPFTEEYQIAGPAVAWMGGIRYAINDRWAVFGEYKGTYNWIEADLDGGGNLDTEVGTHALNFGVSYTFH